MSETVLRDGDVLVRVEGALRRITLNRPKALNALTLGMAETMTLRCGHGRRIPRRRSSHRRRRRARVLRRRRTSGRFTTLRSAAMPVPELLGDEYRLNVLIARYAKPVVADHGRHGDGRRRRASAHAAHRVVTERSPVAMPEVGIGFFPDVGGSFCWRARPVESGPMPALTGSDWRGGRDLCGLADLTSLRARLDGLARRARRLPQTPTCARLLAAMAVAARARPPAAARRWIDPCYAADAVEVIADRLGATADARSARASKP